MRYASTEGRNKEVSTEIDRMLLPSLGIRRLMAQNLVLPEGIETTFTEVDTKTGELVTYDMITGEEIARSGVQPREKFTYSLDIGAAVVNLVRSGKSLKTISEIKGFPSYSMLLRWRMVHPDFKEKLEAARIDHADQLIDAMVDEAETEVMNYTDQELKAFRERVNLHKWRAEKLDPERYGNRTKIDTTINGNAGMFVINTGIDRTPIEAEVVDVVEIDEGEEK